MAALPLPAQPADAVADRLQTCAVETDATQRLSCYDSIAADLRQRKREIVAPTAVTGTVTAMVAQPFGRVTVTLDNGQIWRQNEPEAGFRLQVGDKVHITQGALGAYVLHGPLRATKVTRLQ